jgi:hypothetical protein
MNEHGSKLSNNVRKWLKTIENKSKAIKERSGTGSRAQKW